MFKGNSALHGKRLTGGFRLCLGLRWGLLVFDELKSWIGSRHNHGFGQRRAIINKDKKNKSNSLGAAAGRSFTAISIFFSALGTVCRLCSVEAGLG